MAVEIFTGPQCAHCERAKALLKAEGVAFTELDISEPDNMAELKKRLPRSKSIPQIFAGGEHIGNDEDLSILKSRGELGALAR